MLQALNKNARWLLVDTVLPSRTDAARIDPAKSLTDKPTASEPGKKHLLIITVGSTRHGFILDRPIQTIGRDPQSGICLDYQFISRCHATLLRFPNPDGTTYYQIIDGNVGGKPSKNGFSINGRKCASHNLQNGDEIVFWEHIRATYYLLPDQARGPW